MCDYVLGVLYLEYCQHLTANTTFLWLDAAVE